ncbi:hypothetical protein JCM33374_g2637 [Metschnikowia sp. JCM 33374]|nr:hypothetical protein JCM33374_g2637 [Metschnikowia sp. JCM 33374]
MKTISVVCLLAIFCCLVSPTSLETEIDKLMNSTHNLTTISVNPDFGGQDFGSHDFGSQDFHHLIVNKPKLDTPPLLYSPPEHGHETYKHKLMDEVEEGVLHFISHLKESIRWTRFDVRRFESAIYGLRQELSSLVRVTEIVAPCPILSRRLDYAMEIFQMMLEVAAEMSHEEYYTTIDSYLVKAVSEANVRLLALFDAVGVPDYQARGYAFKVSRFVGQLKTWEREFYLLGAVSGESVAKFRNMMLKAEQTLEVLKSHISLQWF